MIRKNAVLLVFLVFLAHSSSLGNGLIGDDRVIFEQNDFYHSLGNLPRLVQKNFITQFSDLDPSSLSGSSVSGCVSYRPVTALSFFADYFLWETNAWGYHLDNILLHILVCLCLYFLIFQITKSENIAFLSALLFGLHPVHCEAVNGIGYRSDILSALFTLLAFMVFIRYRNAKRPGNILLPLSLGLFFAALFSKESAAALMAIVVAYDLIFLSQDRRPGRFLSRGLEYAAFLGVFLFYAYLYFGVFPNSNSRMLFAGTAHLTEKLALMGNIFSQYIRVLVYPFDVTVLPPLYLPSDGGQGLPYFLAFAAIFSSAIVFFWRRSKIILFFLIWFLATYLPVSEIIVLPNPFAFRFLYLPSVGFFVLAAVGIDVISRKIGGAIQSGRVSMAVKVLIACLLISVTFPFHRNFKNDIIACKAMVSRYPDSARPYLVLGQEYLKQGNYHEAENYFRKYLSQDIRNPFVSVMKQDYFVRYQLGLCFPEDPKAAAEEFRESIRLNPGFVLPYLQIARIFILQGDYARALDFAERAVAVKPDFVPGYVYAIHSCVYLKDAKKAESLLGRVMKIAPQNPDVIYVKHLFENSL